MSDANGATTSISSNDLPLVAICVVTHRRPDALRRLIRSIARLEFRAIAARTVMIVVDNDPHESGWPIVETLRRDLSLQIRYAVEPRRGSAHAWYRSIDLVPDEAEFIALVRDTQRVTPGWIEELLRIEQLYQADIVAGNVLPEFETPPPKWVERGGFFRGRYGPADRTALSIPDGSTLVRAELLRSGVVFIEDPPDAGDTNALLLHELLIVGHKLAHAPDAVVYEHIPAAHMGVGWVLRQAFRAGIAASLAERVARPGIWRGARRIAGGAYRMVHNAALLLVVWPLGLHRVTKCLQGLCYGAGICTDCCGMGYAAFTSRA